MGYILWKEPTEGAGFTLVRDADGRPRRFATMGEAMAAAKADQDFQAAAYQIDLDPEEE